MNRIVITGSSRGLGLALTRLFLNQHWIVFPLVRNVRDANRLKSLCESRCFPMVSDVTSDTLSEDISPVLTEEGPVDVLINNAGTGSSGNTLMETTPETVLGALDVHCLGALRVTRSLLPFMTSDGKIVNISSRFGSISKVSSGELDALSCSYAYRIAKAAQNMFTQCLCREFNNTGLTVFSVHPGRLMTDSGSKDAGRTPDEAAEKLFGLLEYAEHGCFYDVFEGPMTW